MRAYILAEAVAAEGIFELQTNLLGPMNRRGPLWEPRGPYFSDLPGFHQRPLRMKGATKGAPDSTAGTSLGLPKGGGAKICGGLGGNLPLKCKTLRIWATIF